MKRTTRTLIPFLLTLVVIVLINIASTTLFFRVDLTKNQAYSLSEASAEAVRNLNEPLTIKAFFSKNLPAPYNNTEQALRDLLEEYALAGNRFFNYAMLSMPTRAELDGGKSAELEDEAQKYRIFPIQIQNVEQDEVKLQTAYMGVTFIHGDMIETIAAITSTENLEFQITRIINKMGNKISALLALRDDINVTLYLTPNLYQLGSNIEGLPDSISRAVSELNQQYYGRLSFAHVDPFTEGRGDEFERLYNLTSLTLRTRTDTGEIAEKAFASLVITHGDKTYSQNLINRGIFGFQVADVESLKKTIEEITEAVIGINEEIGYITDYGTAPVSDSPPPEQQVPITPVLPDLANFEALVAQDYSLRSLALKDESIPRGLKSLIIAGPKEQLSQYDLYQIDQFLMRGNSLLLFLDAYSIFMPQGGQFGQEPVYLPRDTGLEKLLEHYGVRLKKSFVLDEKSFTQRQRSQNGGIVETPVYFAPIISQEQMTKNIKFLHNIPELVLLYPSALEQTQKHAEGIQITEVFSTSKDGWEASEDINLANPIFIQPPEDDLQSSIPLAFLIEGKLESYFSDKATPEPPEKKQTEEEGSFEQAPSENVISAQDLSVQDEVIKEGNGRIFVIGSSAVLGSNVLDREGQTGNSVFLLNLLDYMNGREDYAVMRTKGFVFTPLKDSTPQLRSFVKTFNIAGLPIIVAIVGLAMLFIRSSRKRRIQYHFTQHLLSGEEKQNEI